VKRKVRNVELERERARLSADAARRKAQAQARGEVGADDDQFEWVELDADGLTAEEAMLKRRADMLSRINSGNGGVNGNAA